MSFFFIFFFKKGLHVIVVVSISRVSAVFILGGKKILVHCAFGGLWNLSKVFTRQKKKNGNR